MQHGRFPARRYSRRCRCARGQSLTASAVPLCGPSSHLPAQGGSPAKCARACVLAVARKPTRSQTRTRKPWVPPDDAARSVPGLPLAGGTHRVREVATPLPFRRQNQPQPQNRGRCPHPRGGCLPPDPRAVFKFCDDASSGHRSDVAGRGRGHIYRSSTVGPKPGDAARVLR
jgi:hypothetical protein